jgi:hypothetical protein
MSRYVSINEKVVDMSLDTSDLDRKIHVDSKTMSVRDATAEEFDIFVYETLYRMYNRRKHALNRYEQSFWQDDYCEFSHRLLALNRLRLLNQEHAGAPLFRPEVPLFVEE